MAQRNLTRYNREIKCKNAIADILKKYNCELIGNLKIDESLYGGITIKMAKNDYADLIIKQQYIEVIANEEVDTEGEFEKRSVHSES